MPAPLRWWALAVLCGSLLVTSLDNTILNVALPTLSRSLPATASQLQWIVDAYTVVFAGLVLVSGSLGDRFGRRRNLLVGLALFGGGSALSAFAGSADRLIGLRAFMGVGGALIMPATLSIINDLFADPRERAKAIGLWSGTTGIGIAAGPLVGGALLAHFWWGAVFLVNVPITVLALIAAALVVPPSSAASPRALDPLGFALSIVGLGSLVWAIIEAPVAGWGSAAVVTAFAVSGTVIAAFLWWERRYAHPLIELELFRNRRFSGANVAVALAVFGLFGAGFLLTQYLQFVLGYSPLATGVRTLPVAAAIAVAAPSSTVLVRHLGTKLVVASGLVLISCALGWLATASVSSGYGRVLPATLVLGLGLGLTMAPATDSIMGAVRRDESGVGAAMDETTIQVGGALGVAALGSVFAAHYGAEMGQFLASRPVPAAVAGLVRTSVGGALAVAHGIGGPVGVTLQGAARRAFVGGMDLAVGVGAVVVVAGALVAATLLPQRTGQCPSG
ncbi:MAG: DHA2 family efflux MFS transporter permease subunit [Mycobacteriales bacterium]